MYSSVREVGSMDAETPSVFDNEYFTVNKKLLLISGLWPHATSINKLSKRFLTVLTLVALAAPSINGIRVWCGKNFAICGENFTVVLFVVAILSKYFSTIFCEKKIKNLFKLVEVQWLTLNNPAERKILQAYAKKGRYIGRLQIGYVVVCGFVFTQSCLINTVLDVVYPLNESRPKMLPVKGEFCFDPYEHHFKIYLVYCMFAVVSGRAIMSIDTMYVAVVHQSLAVFNIVQHRLTQASNCYDNDKDLGYKTVISAIRMHIDALQFLDVIDSSYGICLLLIVSLTAVFLSLGVIVILEHLNNPIEFLKFTLFEIGVVIHLFFLSWPGQQVIDESTKLFRHIYTCEWHSIDKKGKNLIKMMMLRCSRTAKLTACGLYIMSFENYATIIKTTSSYTTVAISIRE